METCIPSNKTSCAVNALPLFELYIGKYFETKYWYENDLIIRSWVSEVLSQLKANPLGTPLPISTKFGTFYLFPKDGISFSTTLFSWGSWSRENVRDVVECPNYLPHGFSIQRSKVLRQFCATNAHLHNLELAKNSGMGKICSLHRGFVFSRLFSYILLLLA